MHVINSERAICVDISSEPDTETHYAPDIHVQFTMKRQI